MQGTSLAAIRLLTLKMGLLMWNNNFKFRSTTKATTSPQRQENATNFGSQQNESKLCTGFSSFYSFFKWTGMGFMKIIDCVNNREMCVDINIYVAYDHISYNYKF